MIGNALFNIRFLSLMLREFNEGPGKSPLLTKDEVFSILTNILYYNKAPKVPKGFCTQRFSRAQSIKITHSTSMGFPGNGESSSSTMQNTSSVLSTVEASSTNPGNLFTSSRGIVMRNRRKYYCIRSISRMNCYNSGVLRHSVKFSVDKNICVIGVQVPTMNAGNNISGPLNKVTKGASFYYENIYVQLLDCNGTQLTHTCLTDACVRTDTLVELIFIRPVYIQKHKVYQIIVKFEDTPVGYYSVGAGIRDEKRCGSMTFTFDRDNTKIYDGFIKSIIFTY